MALLGKGVLAIWNGIDDTAEAEFIKWHIREHIPERVGLPGFLRGRRYVAHEGHPKYFNFYETDTVRVLESDVYRARLNAPTPWTKSVVAHFKDTSRTVCEVVASLGQGESSWIEAIQFAAVPERDALIAGLKGEFLTDISGQDGIVGIHLLRGIEMTTPAATTESKLRSQPDAKCEMIVLIEAAELNFLTALHSKQTSGQALTQRTKGAAVERGIYRLQYALTHRELYPDQ